MLLKFVFISNMAACFCGSMLTSAVLNTSAVGVQKRQTMEKCSITCEPLNAGGEQSGGGSGGLGGAKPEPPAESPKPPAPAPPSPINLFVLSGGQYGEIPMFLQQSYFPTTCAPEPVYEPMCQLKPACTTPPPVAYKPVYLSNPTPKTVCQPACVKSYSSPNPTYQPLFQFQQPSGQQMAPVYQQALYQQQSRPQQNYFESQSPQCAPTFRYPQSSMEYNSQLGVAENMMGLPPSQHSFQDMPKSNPGSLNAGIYSGQGGQSQLQMGNSVGNVDEIDLKQDMCGGAKAAKQSENIGMGTGKTTSFAKCNCDSGSGKNKAPTFNIHLHGASSDMQPPAPCTNPNKPPVQPFAFFFDMPGNEKQVDCSPKFQTPLDASSVYRVQKNVKDFVNDIIGGYRKYNDRFGCETAST